MDQKAGIVIEVIGVSSYMIAAIDEQNFLLSTEASRSARTLPEKPAPTIK